jgi:hypothetical protein
MLHAAIGKKSTYNKQQQLINIGRNWFNGLILVADFKVIQFQNVTEMTKAS